MTPGGEFLLRQIQRTTDDLRLWSSLHPFEIVGRQRLRVPIGARSSLDGFGACGELGFRPVQSRRLNELQMAEMRSSPVPIFPNSVLRQQGTLQTTQTRWPTP